MGIAEGVVLAVLGWILAALVCSALWVGFAVRGIIRIFDGTGGPWASTMAQLSVVAMLLGILRYGLPWGMAALLFPPALLIALPDIADLAITPQIAVYAVPVTVVVLALTIAIARLRLFAIFITSATLLATTLIAGEVISSRAMCATAADQGLTTVSRNSFLWSISNSGNEYQFDVHAMAERGEDRFAWSYSEMDWYTFPDTISIYLQSGDPACSD